MVKNYMSIVSTLLNSCKKGSKNAAYNTALEQQAADTIAECFNLYINACIKRDKMEKEYLSCLSQLFKIKEIITDYARRNPYNCAECIYDIKTILDLNFGTNNCTL